MRMLRMFEDIFSYDMAQMTAVASLREMDTSGEGTLSELFLRLPFKGSALKGKNLLPRGEFGSKFFCSQGENLGANSFLKGKNLLPRGEFGSKFSF